MREKINRATKRSTGVAFGEHDFFRRGIEGGEEFWDEAAFGGAGFAWRDEIANDGVNPDLAAADGCRRPGSS